MLARRLESLRLTPPAFLEGQPVPAMAGRVSGETYVVEENSDGVRSVRFDFAADGGATITLGREHAGQRIPCGAGEWARGEMTMERLGATPTAAAGAWLDGHTHQAGVRLVETPFVRTLTCRFDGDGETVTVEQQVNVAMAGAPTEGPHLRGRRA